MRRYSQLTSRLLVSLSFAGILLLGNTLPAYALLAAHQDFDGCNTCHALHGSPGGPLLAIESDPELLCLSCHGPGGASSLKVTLHNLSGGDITCIECHNSHNNGQENLRTNVDGTYNIKLLGLTYDYNNVGSPLAVASQIREERVATGLGNLKDIIYNSAISDYDRADGLGVCNACHGATHQTGQDCSSCHAHDNGFAGVGDCRACHDGSGLGAEAVSVDSSHSTNTIFASTGETYTCENCHTDHEAGNVQIPNNNAVGIMYNSAGHNGISLGNSGGGLYNAAGLTEAEICWNCHDGFTPAVSEWGVNTDTNGAANDYDFGDIYTSVATTTLTSNWVGAWWKSGTAKFGYKTGQIQSIHAVYNTATQAGMDPVDEIRCSYCHDVHELNLATNDSTSGKPYLRGSWMGSPYREDGAPQVGDSWLTPNGNYGAVPRSGIDSTELGGYQIDQNNGNPTTGGVAAHTTTVTASWELASSAGLCTLCHGTDVDSLNKFGTPANAWVGTNGHANAAIGGSGSSSTNATDIFSMAIRNPSGAPFYDGKGSDRSHPRQSYGNAGSFGDATPSGDNTGDYWGYGFRSQNSGGLQLSPQTTAGFPKAYIAYNWGASVDNTLDDQYHKFSCSKCHNPHASRLPRLLITNCLDTKHNDWDDQAGVSTLGTSTTDYAPENRGVTFAMATSAQNCHRLADTTNYSNATGDGWNMVSPWTVEGTQDNPGID